MARSRSHADGRRAGEDVAGVQLCNALPSDLIARYRQPLVAYFHRRLRTQADAEDLAQQVFVRLSQRQNGEVHELAAGYIFTVAANLLRDFARNARSTASTQHVEIDGPQSLDQQAHDPVEPERVLLGRERLSCVLAALDSAPERTRAIFLLFRLDGMRQKDIARSFNISVSAVEKHIVRAVQHVSAALIQYDLD